MDTPLTAGLAARLLLYLLRNGDGTALLGDLAEDHLRRSRVVGAHEAARRYRHQLYGSLAAVLRLRAVEWVQAVPWGTAAAAYVVVGVFEFAFLMLLSWTWPGVAHETSALRLVIEFPGVAAIAYVAARVHSRAPFVLGGMMLLVAVLLLSLSTEAVSSAFVIAFLTVGPLAALLGGLLHRRWRTAAFAGVAVLVVAGSASAQQTTPVTDPSKTTHGEKSPRAPQQLNAFDFLVGTWSGQGRTRLPNGKIAEYPVKWVGRYILDGTVIADEAHAVRPDGSPYLGITFRQFDTNRATWVIEYLAVSDSFLRRQVHPGAGAVIVDGRNVTVVSEGPALIARERYLVRDNDNWVFRLDVSYDAGKSWNEELIEFTLRRSQ